MVEYPTTKDFKFTREDGGVWAVEAAYDDEAPLFGNISMHVTFDKTVRMAVSTRLRRATRRTPRRIHERRRLAGALAARATLLRTR